MDLKEITTNPRRHPWELARARALRRLVRANCPWGQVKRVLDVGCGDAFLLNELCQGRGLEAVHGVDSHLSQPDIDRLAGLYPYINLSSSLPSLPAQRYDLIFLFDLIEHVPDDKVFCEQIVRDYLAPGGILVITAPASNHLWSFHDEFLNHYRRYDLKGISSLASDLGLFKKDSGFFFSSLIFPRAFSCFKERLSPSKQEYSGAGRWQGGDKITKMIEWSLDMDNRFLWHLHQMNINVPGLSVWAVFTQEET